MSIMRGLMGDEYCCYEEAILESNRGSQKAGLRQSGYMLFGSQLYFFLWESAAEPDPASRHPRHALPMQARPRTPICKQLLRAHPILQTHLCRQTFRQLKIIEIDETIRPECYRLCMPPCTPYAILYVDREKSLHRLATVGRDNTAQTH